MSNNTNKTVEQSQLPEPIKPPEQEEASTSIVDSDTTKSSKPPTESPPLPEPYHKARKQYVLLSALLIALPVLRELTPSTNNEELIFGSIKITNFALLPLVLIVLMVYSSIRITIEWLQADENRRDLDPSKYDFFLSHAIAIAAPFVFFIMKLRKIGLTEASEAPPMRLIISLILGGSIPCLFYILFKLSSNKLQGENFTIRFMKNNRTISIIMSIALLGINFFVLILYLAGIGIKKLPIMVLITFSLSFYAVILMILHRKVVIQNN